jgi:ABC-2 type transport system permease protein
MFIELAFMTIKLTYLVVIMQTGTNIGGLTPDMMMMFIGVYIFMTGIWMMLSGVNSIPGNVLSGQLDMLITKPGSLMFLQTFGNFSFGMMFSNCTAGIILICLSWTRTGTALNFINIAGFSGYMILAMILTYAVIMIPSLLVLFVTSVNGVDIIFAALWDFNNMPMKIYNKTVQKIGTFIIPVFMLTNWGGLFVFEQLSTFEKIWGIILPFIILLIARIMWVRGMRRYSSANG